MLKPPWATNRQMKFIGITLDYRRSVMIRNLICLTLLVISTLATAKVDSSGRDTIRHESTSLPNTQIRHLHSENTGVDYKLYINIPASYYNSENKKYPVLYLLDADYSFLLAKQASEHLSDRNRIDEVLLVGIAYDGPNQYRLHRTRDYTISHTLVGGYTPEMQKQSGGAKKFTAFIKNELVPYIAFTFPVNDSRGLVGHSLGGLYATYTLINEPELFDKHIIISASLWYDNEKLLKQASQKNDFNYEKSHTVFMAIGGEENGGNYRMIDEQNNFLKIVSQKENKNLKMVSQVLDHFDHDMIVPAAISRGLMVLYG